MCTIQWNTQDEDETIQGEQMPQWHRYLLYLEQAKIRNEIAMSLEDWKDADEFEKRRVILNPDPAA